MTDHTSPTPSAIADRLIADGAAASMHPLDLLPSEVADYDEACEIAAAFLATPVTLAVPVSASSTDVGTGTLAHAFKIAGGVTSDRVAIHAAAGRIAGWVNTYEQHGASRVYLHRLASITVSADADDVTSPRLFLIEVPTGTGLAKTLTADGAKPYALVALFPDRTYNMTDRVTGEVMPRVDLGNYNPERVWPGNGGIVRMLDRDQADGIELDWSYDPDTRNLAWALSTLRRLSKIAANRADRRDQIAQAHAEEHMPF